MKKIMAMFILSAMLVVTSGSTVTALETDRLIPISNIETVQGVVSVVNDEFVFIETVDGCGWALEIAEGEAERILFSIEKDGDLRLGDNVVIVYDSLGTDDIYDDEIIKIVVVK